MKQLHIVLSLLLLGACSEKVEVTINAPSPSWEVHGVDTISVTCHPVRNIYYVELLIDSGVAGVDTYPSPNTDFIWDVRSLPEASVHSVQARAVSGSHEYLSPMLSATVGYRSRLLLDGPDDSLLVYRPDGRRDTGFVPLAGGNPVSPRFVVGCESVVFLSQHKLYGIGVPGGPAQSVDSVENGIYSCDASPVSHAKVFEGYPAATAHLFYKDWFDPKVQLTHDSDFVLIDSSRFTCIANSNPVFSPDGLRIAYYRKSRCLVPGDPHEGETREDVFVIGHNGSNPVNLTAGVEDGYFSGFTWTFDGKWVLFREGMDPTPDRVLAANMSGRVVAGLPVSPVAMACSPHDSMLVYIGTEAERHLYAARLDWTEDTIYVSVPGSVLSGATFDRFLDWVEYSGE